MGRASPDDFNLNGHGKMRGQMLSGFNHLTSAMINLKYFVFSSRVEFLHRNKAVSHGRLFAGDHGHNVHSQLGSSGYV